MINWLFEAQVPLSITLLLLLGIERYFTPRIGAKLAYQLWLFVPLVLMAGMLPQNMVALEPAQIQRYVIGLTSTMSYTQFDSMFSLWVIGVVTVTAFIGAQYLVIRASIVGPVDSERSAFYAKRATTPMLFGFIMPSVLLPTDFKQHYTPHQQQLIVEHETTHAKQWDHIWNTLALTLAILCWFNPLVWLGLRSFRVNQELACDSRVLKNKTPQEKLLYAKALVKCAQRASLSFTPYPTFTEKNTMIKRLTNMQQLHTKSKLLSLASIILVGTFTANVALAKLGTPAIDTDKINIAPPVVRVDPIYPKQAIEQNLEGSVIMKFDITETGSTSNIRVVESSPSGVFDDVAVNALTQWRYKPRIQGGKAMAQQDLLVQLDFKLGPDTSADTSNSAE